MKKLNQKQLHQLQADKKGDPQMPHTRRQNLMAHRAFYEWFKAENKRRKQMGVEPLDWPASNKQTFSSRTGPKLVRSQGRGANWQREANADLPILSKNALRALQKQQKRLLDNGWKQTAKGWRHGNKASVDFEQANRQVIADLTKAKAEHEAGIPEVLRSKGWTEGENGTWSRPNWQIEGGLRYRTLKQAYKIQIGLEAQGVK
jgi:hypothetical protein